MSVVIKLVPTSSDAHLSHSAVEPAHTDSNQDRKRQANMMSLSAYI